MNHNDRTGRSITERLTDTGRRLQTPLAAVCAALLASGVVAAVAVTPAPQRYVTSAISLQEVAGVTGAVPGLALPAAPRTPETDDVDLHCFTSQVENFDPGLTEDPTPMTTSGYINGGTELSPTTPCSSATGVPYKGLTILVKGSGEIACTTARGVLGNAEGTADIIWDNGDESTAKWKAISYGALPVTEWTITDGDLKGYSAYREGVPTSLTGNCARSPVTSLSHSGVMTFLSPENLLDSAG